MQYISEYAAFCMDCYVVAATMTLSGIVDDHKFPTNYRFATPPFIGGVGSSALCQRECVTFLVLLVVLAICVQIQSN